MTAALAVVSAHAEDRENNPAKPVRPASWATPVETNGVPNLHRLNPKLYRSAQPTAEGMKTLHEIGTPSVNG